MPTEIADPRQQRARAAAQDGRWEEAAATWAALAVDLAPRDPGAAAQGWSLAADAWRRADRPVPGVRALRSALDLHRAGPGRALLELQLAGLLAEVGELLPGLDLARAVRPSTAGEAALRADLLCGLLLEVGALDEAAQALAELTEPRAQAFRAALLHRVRGDLPAAAAALDRARAGVGEDAALAGLRAALAHEAGELALLSAEPVEAAAAFQVAAGEWAHARRRSGVLRAAAGSVRAELAMGRAPLAADVARGVEYAADRRLSLLEAEILLARGAARARLAVSGAEADLDRAVALAEASGARLAEGRARQARRTAGIHRRGEAERITALLAGTVWGD